jgi:hypothetical protein
VLSRCRHRQNHAITNISSDPEMAGSGNFRICADYRNGGLKKNVVHRCCYYKTQEKCIQVCKRSVCQNEEKKSTAHIPWTARESNIYVNNSVSLVPKKSKHASCTTGRSICNSFLDREHCFSSSSQTRENRIREYTYKSTSTSTWVPDALSEKSENERRDWIKKSKRKKKPGLLPNGPPPESNEGPPGWNNIPLYNEGRRAPCITGR